jgi:DNA-binding CsgD family transcriptional regulator
MSEIKITPRQAIIFQYFIDGKTSKEIALLLGVKTRTVRRHMQHVKQKVGAVSLYQCVAILVAEKVVIPTIPPFQISNKSVLPV